MWGENEGKNSILSNAFSLPPDTDPSQEVLCILRAYPELLEHDSSNSE